MNKYIERLFLKEPRIQLTCSTIVELEESVSMILSDKLKLHILRNIHFNIGHDQYDELFIEFDYDKMIEDFGQDIILKLETEFGLEVNQHYTNLESLINHNMFDECTDEVYVNINPYGNGINVLIELDDYNKVFKPKELIKPFTIDEIKGDVINE